MTREEKLFENYFYTAINKNNTEFYLFLQERIDEEDGLWKKTKQMYFQNHFPKLKTIQGYINKGYTNRVLQVLKDSEGLKAPPSIQDDIPKGFYHEFK